MRSNSTEPIGLRGSSPFQATRCYPAWSAHAAPGPSSAVITGRSSSPRLCCHCRGRHQHSVDRARQALAEWRHGKLQRQVSRRVSEPRMVLLARRGEGHHRSMAPPLQRNAYAFEPRLSHRRTSWALSATALTCSQRGKSSQLTAVRRLRAGQRVPAQFRSTRGSPEGQSLSCVSCTSLQQLQEHSDFIHACIIQSRALRLDQEKSINRVAQRMAGVIDALDTVARMGAGSHEVLARFSAHRVNSWILVVLRECLE
jgi:hypothetical protein